MKILLLMLAVAPLRAQVPAAPEQVQKDGKALAAAAAAAAPVAVAGKPVNELMECLIKRGSPMMRSTEILHIVQKSDSPSARTRRDFTMVLAEAPPDPAAGRLGDEKSMYYDLLERHTYNRFEMQVITTTAGKDGKGEIDSRIYYLSVGAKLYDALGQNGPGVFAKDGSFVPDPSKLKTTKYLPSAAKADWEKLAPYLAMLCSSIEV